MESENRTDIAIISMHAFHLNKKNVVQGRNDKARRPNEMHVFCCQFYFSTAHSLSFYHGFGENIIVHHYVRWTRQSLNWSPLIINNRIRWIKRQGRCNQLPLPTQPSSTTHKIYLCLHSIHERNVYNDITAKLAQYDARGTINQNFQCIICYQC